MTTSHKEINMRELTQELNALGLPANYVMSGGDCGTIYVGEPNEEGYYPYAIGPSVYSTGVAYSNELCWGIDGEEIATYYDFSFPFTPSALAQVIVDSMKMEVK